MSYKFLKYITAIILGISLLGCQEDYLDIKPIAASSTGTFYASMTDMEQAVTAAYSPFNNVAAYDRDLLMLADIASDDSEAGGEYVNEVPDFEAINRLSPFTTNGFLANNYGNMYLAINLSNLAMEKIPNIKKTDPNADPGIIDRRVAECKFIRAINYSYLTKVYGAVPLVDHTLGASEFKMGKSPLKEIYNLMEKDLKEAIEVLPERSNSLGPNIGRATKGAAKALLARILLFESSYAKNYPGDERFNGMKERWTEALDYAEQVIKSGEYKLTGIDGEKYLTWRDPQTNGYRYIFTSNGNNSPEAIFEIQCIRDGLAYGATRGSALTGFTAARRYIDPATGLPQNTGYWGLNIPNQSMVDEYEKGDPRLKATIAMQGDSIEMHKIKGQRRFLISFDKCVTGYYCTKFESSGPEYQDFNGPWHSSPLNVHLIRYADVVLIASEAALMSGDNTKARDYINMVRTRARNCGTSNVPADLTGTVTLENIIHERRVELAIEGHRFFDLVRWKLGQKYLSNTTTTDGYPLNFESPKNDFFPLPSNEISASGGNLEQNPGW